MTHPHPHLENPTSKTFRTSPPIPPLKGGGLGWGGEGDKTGQNPRTFPHLSAPQIDKVRNGGNQPKCIYPHCSANPAHCLPECKGRDYSQSQWHCSKNGHNTHIEASQPQPNRCWKCDSVAFFVPMSGCGQ